MYEGKTIGAVVPARNAADSVGGVIDALPEFVDRAYVVDDGSTDHTLRVVRERATAANDTHADAPATVTGVTLTPRVIPIVHGENRGVGAAVKTGYRRALADGVDVALVVNGDCRTAPDALERIVRPVAAGDADYATESRSDRDAPLRHRGVGDLALSFFTKLSSGYWDVADPRNGSTAISWAAMEAVDVEALYEDRGYRGDLLARLNAVDATIADVTGRATSGDEPDDSPGSSVPRVSALLLRNFAWRLRAKYFDRGSYPIPLFYVLGALGAGAGVAAVAAALLFASAGVTHALAVLAAGALFVGLAMVLDRTENRDLAVRADDAR